MTSEQTVNLFKTIGYIFSLISQARSRDVGAVIHNFEDYSFERVVHNLVDYPGSSIIIIFNNNVGMWVQ